MMVIKISNMSNGLHRFVFDELSNDLGLEEPFYGNVSVEANLNKLHDQIILSASVRLHTKCTCDRCNKDFEKDILTDYKMVYLFGSQQDSDELPDLTFLPRETDKILLDNDVRDYAMLALPMKILCDKNCKGLCSHCGHDLNEGPCQCNDEAVHDYWLPLLELKKKYKH